MSPSQVQLHFYVFLSISIISISSASHAYYYRYLIFKFKRHVFGTNNYHKIKLLITATCSITFNSIHMLQITIATFSITFDLIQRWFKSHSIHMHITFNSDARSSKKNLRKTGTSTISQQHQTPTVRAPRRLERLNNRSSSKHNTLLPQQPLLRRNPPLMRKPNSNSFRHKNGCNYQHKNDW